MTAPRTWAVTRDEDCMACGWPETYGEVELGAPLGDGLTHVGCRRCGWRVEADVLAGLTTAQLHAYAEALHMGSIYQSHRGHLAYETPGRRQYSARTIAALVKAGLIEYVDYGRYALVPTDRTQWVVVDADGEVVWYLPTEEQAARAAEARADFMHHPPGHTPKA